MSNATTDENMSTSQVPMTSTVTDALNSLSLTETNSIATERVPEYTTWVRVLEDVDDWEKGIPESELHLPRLKVRAGDIYKVEERLPDNNFWLGSNGTDTGLFPLDTRVAPVVYSKVIGLYDRDNPELAMADIPFKSGQVMDVITVPSIWWVRVGYDWTLSSGEKKRIEGTIPFVLVHPIPPEGMSDNPRPEFNLDAIDKYPRWEDVPEFSVRVVSDYKAQYEGEIDLMVNDIIVITKIWSDVWYYGSINGHFGKVATRYVSKDLTLSIRPPYHRYYVRVVQFYASTGPSYMDLLPNEIIEVIWIHPNGWWEGRSRDGKRRGLFASRCVRKMVNGGIGL